MEILGVRLDTRTKRGLEIITKVMKMTPSKWIAGLIAENLPKAIEEVKSEIIFSYVRGEISGDELREVFGDDAEDIVFVVEKTKEDFKKAERIR